MNVSFPYTVEVDEDGYFFVQFVDIEEAFTQGENLEEAAFNASEVLSAMLESRLEMNQDVPDPSICPSNGFMATPSIKIQSALLLRKARGNRSLTELANAMNTTWTAVEQLENPRHSSSLNQLDKAARALGKKLILSFE
jgi:antitoxin HicB